MAPGAGGGGVGSRATLVGVEQPAEERPDDVPTGRRVSARARLRTALAGWRWGTPTVVVVCGALFAVSALNSEGTDLRPGRYRDLASVVEAESRQYEALEGRVNDLAAQVDVLSGAVGSGEVDRYQRRIERLSDPAGLEPRRGAGVSVVLADAPAEAVDGALADGDVDLNRLVVHQQDIQAVVNALWKGGASAVTVQGQRIVSTTGIKCEGNAVQLQGIPYPQPYEIEAVGDPEALVAAVETDDYLANYRLDAADPGIDIGWELDLEPDVVAPAYEGLLDLAYAEPLG